MNNYSVIRILKEENGQHCVVEYELANKADAEYFKDYLNKQYSTTKLEWIVDTH